MGNIAQNATSHGYRVLWSPTSVWYLSHNDSFWTNVYKQEPCEGIAADVCETLVLGGGGELWGEMVDASDIMQTIWPRLGAIGERLWSPQNITDYRKAQPRLMYFRCMLNQRGVAAAPLTNRYARSAPPRPGSCYEQ